MVPRVFIFGAKAALVITSLNLLSNLSTKVANLVNNDESLQGKLKVVFLENYRAALRNLSFQQQMSLNKSHWLLKKHLVPQT